MTAWWISSTHLPKQLHSWPPLQTGLQRFPPHASRGPSSHPLLHLPVLSTQAWLGNLQDHIRVPISVDQENRDALKRA